jgi:hypothetical protein
LSHSFGQTKHADPEFVFGPLADAPIENVRSNNFWSLRERAGHGDMSKALDPSLGPGFPEGPFWVLGGCQGSKLSLSKFRSLGKSAVPRVLADSAVIAEMLRNFKR